MFSKRARKHQARKGAKGAVSARHQPPCVASGTYTEPRNIVQPPPLRCSKALLAYALSSGWIFWGNAFQSWARSQIFTRSALFLDRHDTSSRFPRLLGLEPHTPRFPAISRSSRDSARRQPPCVSSGTYTEPRNIVQPPSLRGSKALLAHALTSRWVF